MKVFEYDSGFMKTALLLSRLTLLNIIWLICCIPIVTIGPATAAQYYTANRLFRGSTEVLPNFKSGFKLHWKRAAVIWIVFALLTVAFAAACYILTAASVPGRTALISISGLAYLTAALIMLWVYPVMINFTGSLAEILFNSFVFTFMYAPVTLIAAGLYGVAGFLFLRFTFTKGLCILFGPSLIVYGILVLFEKVFRKYR
ncbi:YesL family protein [Extibacter muris]|uniref:YesL family protein n=1 Tax=Extibacter muris TaxID=1796622 RepID=UPI001D095A9C|nr:DUF624 domain-containing protein [Extibacter muris]MCB6201520.1 DUF624 domain-containing protein [Extibacter muris]MCQ4662846.1 DUF624 domain-containing protein [Extibacter muris]MCQ4692739.1 DUF624 domain-containing protein [Extibacter muris]